MVQESLDYAQLSFNYKNKSKSKIEDDKHVARMYND